MRAIRFQVQNVDGTQNEIVLGKMLFSGSLGNLYQSPPPYVLPQPAVRRNGSMAAPQQLLSYVAIAGRVRFRIPARFAGMRIVISGMNGEMVRTLSPDGHREITWDLKDRKGAAVASGVYLVTMKNKAFKTAIPLVITLK
jgi:hypothetical protein